MPQLFTDQSHGLKCSSCQKHRWKQIDLADWNVELFSFIASPWALDFEELLYNCHRRKQTDRWVRERKETLALVEPDVDLEVFEVPKGRCLLHLQSIVVAVRLIIPPVEPTLVPLRSEGGSKQLIDRDLLFQRVRSSSRSDAVFCRMAAKHASHTGFAAHPSPHFAADRNPSNSPLLTSISANRRISGSSRCSGMLGISS